MAIAATDVTVRVNDINNNPIQNATVCVDPPPLQGSPAQLLTDINGEARFKDIRSNVNITWNVVHSIGSHRATVPQYGSPPTTPTQTFTLPGNGKGVCEGVSPTPSPVDQPTAAGGYRMLMNVGQEVSFIPTRTSGNYFIPIHLTYSISDDRQVVSTCVTSQPRCVPRNQRRSFTQSIFPPSKFSVIPPQIVITANSVGTTKVEAYDRNSILAWWAEVEVQAPHARPMPSPTPPHGVAAFTDIQDVFIHPRCKNCHTSEDRPKVGEGSTTTHVMFMNNQVERGDGNCLTCHSLNNPPTTDPDYQNAPKVVTTPVEWHMPDVTDSFDNKSITEICNHIVMREGGRNNLQDLEDNLVDDHIEIDNLVKWAFNPVTHNPNYTLQSPNMTHFEFVAKMRQWIQAGASCP